MYIVYRNSGKVHFSEVFNKGIARRISVVKGNV